MRIYNALGILTLSGLLSGQPVTFISQSQVSVGAHPVSMVMGQFTGDTTLDLVVADRGAAMLSVLQGLGHGFFGRLTTTPTGISPNAVATGDFNGDGRPDLAVANFASNSISVLLATGPGTFRTIENLAAQGPTAIAVGDFNGDGNLDLAVTETTSNNIAVLLGGGNGSFPTVFRFPVGQRPVSVAAGDFNGDGKLDLAVANRNSNSVSILLGIGRGVFRPARNFAAGDLPVYVTAGDFNDDGKPDLAVANANGFPTGTVSVLLGAGGGVFLAPLTFAVQANPSFVAAADFNLDGKIDLAIANADSNTISVLLGIGNGTFLPQTAFDVDSGPAWIGVADLNGDGKPDLVVANSISSTVQTLINRTGGTNSFIGSIVNAASFTDGPIAPGEIVTIFGSNLTDTVSFDGALATPIFSSPTQINVTVPYSVTGPKTVLKVGSTAVRIAVAQSAPGIFAAVPVDNNVITLYATGCGVLINSDLPRCALPVFVTANGRSTTILFAGSAPGLVEGANQINIQLPEDTPAGPLSIVLTVSNENSKPFELIR